MHEEVKFAGKLIFYYSTEIKVEVKVVVEVVVE